MVRVVPETGEVALYLGRRPNAYIEGMALSDSEVRSAARPAESCPPCTDRPLHCSVASPASAGRALGTLRGQRAELQGCDVHAQGEPCLSRTFARTHACTHIVGALRAPVYSGRLAICSSSTTDGSSTCESHSTPACDGCSGGRRCAVGRSLPQGVHTCSAMLCDMPRQQAVFRARGIAVQSSEHRARRGHLAPARPGAHGSRRRSGAGAGTGWWVMDLGVQAAQVQVPCAPC